MNDDILPRTASPEPTAEGPTIAAIGGWPQIPERAAALVDDPELVDLTRLVVDDEPPTDLAGAVHAALIDALDRCASPAIVHECLEILLESSSVLQQVGERLYRMCLTRAKPPAFDASPRSWLLAADALEAATRLALGGWGQRFFLLAELMQLPPVAPPLFVRSALRCLAASYEQWREPELVGVLEQLAGIRPSANPVQVDTATAEQWAHDIAADAAYELGCASLLQAFGVNTLLEAEEHLQAAEHRLANAAADREDAAVLADVVRLLSAQLPTDTGRNVRASVDLTALANHLEQRVKEHVLGYAGLNHWRTPRLDAEVAWAQLAHDVAHTSTALEEASWYHAEETLANVLAAYTASRCSRVLRREDQIGVRAILAPSIESGIAVQAGLMKHLEDHIRALEADSDAGLSGTEGTSVGTRRDSERTTELAAARSLLTEARAQLATADHVPKPHGSAATSSDGPATLPLLHRLLGGDTATMNSLPSGIAHRLETALFERKELHDGVLAARDALVVQDTFVQLQRGLRDSEYYCGEVKEVVDELMLMLLRFWRSRDGFSPSRMPYLFNPKAVEEDLARDLKTFFDGNSISTLMATEVRDVGGGRVDVTCFYPRFRLYIELKQDDRKIDVVDKRRYLAQTAGYQGADVPIGFLAVLDLQRRTGPTPHLRSCFGVVVRDNPDLGQPRHIVAMSVPGNRTEPSSMR